MNMHATFVTQCTISLIVLKPQNSSHERFKHPATNIWKGMLMRQIQRRSLIWLVKAFLLINRSKSKKICVHGCDFSSWYWTDRWGTWNATTPNSCSHCSGIGLLVGMTNLLTVLVRLCLAIQKPFPCCIMRLKLHKCGLRCSVSFNILVTYRFYVWSSGIILQRRNDLLICSVHYLIFFTSFLKTNLVIWKVLSYSSTVQVNIHSLLNWTVSKRNLQLGIFCVCS